MVEQFQASTDAQLGDLLDRHEALQYRLQFDPRSAGRPSVEEVDELLSDLRPIAARVQTTEQYEQMNRIAQAWQSAFFLIFDIPRDVRRDIGLRVPPTDLQPTARRCAPHEVTEYLGTRAHEISRIRKIACRNREISRLMKNPESIDGIRSDESEMQRDWYDACLFFASDVLQGTIHFVDQLDCDAFTHLEGTWLSDVKAMMAYLIWERDGERPYPILKKRHYYVACQTLHDRVLDEAMKAKPDNFGRILSWLERSYLQYGSLRVERTPRVRSLIAQKARRIWEHTGNNDVNRNWLDAERFVFQFYSHIVPAIRHREQGAVSEVLAALSATHERPIDIVNAFEASLVIYGLDVARLESLYNPLQSFV
jgi:hypothetical protein